MRSFVLIAALIVSPLIIAAACSSPSKADAPAPEAPKPPPAPHNFVCDRFHEANDKAACVPTYTDVGELHTHSAIVTLGTTQVSCTYNTQMIGVECKEPISIRLQPPQQEPGKDAPKGKAKK